MNPDAARLAGVRFSATQMIPAAPLGPPASEAARTPATVAMPALSLPYGGMTGAANSANALAPQPPAPSPSAPPRRRSGAALVVGAAVGVVEALGRLGDHEARVSRQFPDLDAVAGDVVPRRVPRYDEL